MLRRWQNGSEQAFDAFYMKYSLQLLRIAFNKVGVIEVAEEIVQDCFITFYQNRNQIEDNPFIYIKTILKFKILNYKRTLKNTPISIEYINENAQPSPLNPFETVRVKEIKLQISKYIQLLPEQCRKVFIMSREEGFPNKEISERLGISIKTVEAHISKAIKFMREHIDSHPIYFYLIFGLEILIKNTFKYIST